MSLTETLALLWVGLLGAQERTGAEARAILVDPYGTLHQIEDRDKVVLGIRGGDEGLEGISSPARRVRGIRNCLHLAFQRKIRSSRRLSTHQLWQVNQLRKLTSTPTHRARESIHENLGACLQHEREGPERPKRGEPDGDIDDSEQKP